MREEPPDDLVDLLGRLRLADAVEVREAYGRAKRLAVGLPLFSSVWVDALTQARRLTAFQAREINARRGDQLAVGSFVLLDPLCDLGYAVSHRARPVEGGRPVDLLIAMRTQCPAQPIEEPADERLDALVKKLAAVDHPGVLPAERAGRAAAGPWIALAPARAPSLAKWVLQKGRLPPDAVAEIARQMVAALEALARSGLAHGDVAASAIDITSDGTVRISRAGIRGIWRLDERAVENDFPPEAFDTLAPERIASAAAPTAASDLYACGALWWQLLTGRSPLVGGDVRTKLRAVQAAKIGDVRLLAPYTPPWLAEAISRCTERDPKSRPASFAELRALVGAATPAGRRHLSALAGGSGERRQSFPGARKSWRTRIAWAPMVAVVGSVVAIMVACVAWPGATAKTATANPARSTGEGTLAISPAERPALRAATPTQPGRLPKPELAGRRTLESSTHNSEVAPAEFLISAADHPPTSMKRPTRAAGKTIAVAPADWILPCDKPLVCNGGSWSALEVGQTVRGVAGKRPLLLVPPGGMLVATEDVRFVNIDFAWLQPPDAAADPERLAIVELRTARAAFQGCTFHAEPLGEFGSPVAIRWTGPTGRAATATSGRLGVNQCAVRGVAAGIEWPATIPAVLQVNDSLLLGPGPLVNFPRLPHLDAPAAIVLRHATLRAAVALLELHARKSSDEAGPIQVKADECAFAPRQGGALLLVAGTADPRTTARALDWSGQGSVLTPDTAVAARDDRGQLQPLAEAEVSIDGLVSNRVEFAGLASVGPAGSRLIRWQAPLESADPPGIDAAVPAWPSLPAARRSWQPLDNGRP
jgi:serine/threonine-protein kinase